MMLYKCKPPITSRIIFLYINLLNTARPPAAPAARRSRKHQHEEHKRKHQPPPLLKLNRKHKPQICTT